jgi:hypothetical protein
MDPITILAACTAVWNGIKKASEFAQEAEGVWSQLSKYAGLADQLEQHITTAKNKPQKPKLFGKLEFGNDTQEAFNVFEAEHKLMQMEAEIKHEFLYGAFADLEGGYGSLDGYRKFLEMRRKIRADRIRMKQEQQDMQKKFWDDMLLYGGSSTVVVVGCLLLYMALTLFLTLFTYWYWAKMILPPCESRCKIQMFENGHNIPTSRNTLDW